MGTSVPLERVQLQRAAEALADGVSRANQAARGRLLEGMTGPQVYEAITRVLMRNVFHLVAEERGLLPTVEGPHDAEQDAMSTLLDRLEEDAPRVLRHLQVVDGQRISFGQLDVEEIGHAYEGLLDQTAVLGEDGEVQLSETSHRSDHGSYYTPRDLVDEVLDHVLEPALHEALAGLPVEDREQALLAFTVFDPACGSGAFLVGAARRLAAHLEEIRRSTPGARPTGREVAEVTARCLYGADLDPVALELTRLSLWIEGAVADQSPGLLDHHLVVADSLVGARVDELEDSIPDGAFRRTALDDPAVLKRWRHANRQRSVTPGSPVAAADHDPELARARALADAWCAAFTLPATAGQPSPVEAYHDLREGGVPPATPIGDRPYGHWELAFPELEPVDGALFDVVVGNPPYLRGREHGQLDPKGRAFCTHRWSACRGSTWNLYVPFILEAARLARRRSGLLVQSSVLGAQYSGALHAELLDRHGVAACLDFSAVPDLFASAAVQVACLVVTSTPRPTTTFRRYGAGLAVQTEVEVTREELDRLPHGHWTLPTSGLAEEAIAAFLHPPLRLGDIADIRDGMEQDAAYDVRPLVHEATGGPGELALTTTGLIDPFTNRWGAKPVTYLKGRYERPVLHVDDVRRQGHEDMAEQGEAEKIAVAGMGRRIEAVVDEGTALVSKSAMAIRLREPELCPHAVAVLLNSALVNAMYDAAFGALGFGAGTRNYRPPTLGALPLPARELLRRSDAPGSLSQLGRAVAAGDPRAADRVDAAARAALLGDYRTVAVASRSPSTSSARTSTGTSMGV